MRPLSCALLSEFGTTFVVNGDGDGVWTGGDGVSGCGLVEGVGAEVYVVNGGGGGLCILGSEIGEDDGVLGG